MGQQIPERIGRYQVQALLGHGGMGNVYLAVDPRLKRQLAIKTVRNREDDDQDKTLERFSREAEISAQLCHPNIITIYDVGEDPGVGVFLAMEYVKGQSLAAHIRDRRPGFESSLYLLVQAMRALQVAHDGAIIHRDIKPENMMVSETGRLKLMDFGLARGNHSRLTATGMVMGTPSFTAPELMMGKSPSAATDRYAFAVTAFELLSGSLPFAGESLGSTLYRIVHDPPNIPEGMDPRLSSVFLKALAKDPEDRHPDLKNFMIELIRACPLGTQVQNKLLNYVEAESPGQDMLAREPVAGGVAPAVDAASKVETQIVKPSEAASGGVSPTSAVPAEHKEPARGKAPGSKPMPSKPRPSGPPLKLNWSNLLGKAPAPALPKPPPTKAPVLRIPAPSAKTVTPKSGMPSPGAPGPFPFKLRMDPPPTPVPEFREKPQHTDLHLPEPIFDLEAGPIDDPFKDLDWDRALSAPEPSAEVLLSDDLGSALDDLHGMAVPDHLQATAKDLGAQEQVMAMASLLDGLSSADVLEAENRAESEEALHDLEDTLGKVDL